jgi:regulator of cell morphogenesis and NO signaling
MTIASSGSWSERFWSIQPLPALIDHIIDEYHHPLLRDVDAVERLLNILLTRDVAHADLLRPMADIWAALQTELLSHTADEEIVCFPHIVGLTQGEISTALDMSTMLPKLTRDHADLVVAMHKIRELTEQFQPPATACVLLSALFVLLEDVERQLLQRVHLEQSILYPRAAALEAEVRVS